MQEQDYNVEGMSCAACSMKVEKAVKSLDGVKSCNVSLLTNSLKVEGDISDDDVIKAVEDAGYKASSKNATFKNESKYLDKLKADEESLKDHETPKLKKRLKRSIVFLLLLMYFSMGKNMLGLPVPNIIDNPYALAVIQMLIALFVMSINGKFFTNGFSTLLRRSPNMDTLVALGSSISFIYSLFELLLIFNYGYNGDMNQVHSLYHKLYFESAAMIPTLITVGKMLEAMSKGKTTDALKGLIKLSPKKAFLIKDGKEIEVSIDDVKIGDIFISHPGESIAVDGSIIEGETAIDESMLTGESVAVDKAINDKVYAGTINKSGYIKCRAEKIGEDTGLSQIIKMVSDASASKAPIARIADKIAGIFVPFVMGVSLLTFIIWIIAGKDMGFSVARAISVLVISCPCALGLATPVAIMVANGKAAGNSILFKTAESMEKAGAIDIAVLDKTGTVTKGDVEIKDIYPETSEFISFAYAMEQYSEHPLAKAIVRKGESLGIKASKFTNFKAIPGHGIEAFKDGHKYYSGNFEFIRSKIELPDNAIKLRDQYVNEGKTVIFFSDEEKFIGLISLSDTIKEDSFAAIKELENMGIKTVMLTGDNEKAAENIAKAAGIKHVLSKVLPGGKEEIIRALKEKGTVAMVGDGINDAPALTRADLGFAIGAGTDIAIDAADIVLMKSSIRDFAAAIRLSRAAIKNIHENLFWAFFYNIICIPLAAGFYQAVFGWKWEMNPMLGAAAMSISSFTVCSNALRLNLTRIFDPKKDKNRCKNPELEQEIDDIIEKINKKNKEKNLMTKTMHIEGMMCPHCEAAVKKALEAIDGVIKAEPNHEKDIATLTLEKEISDDVLKKAVEEKDYKVISID